MQRDRKGLCRSSYVTRACKFVLSLRDSSKSGGNHYVATSLWQTWRDTSNKAFPDVLDVIEGGLLFIDHAGYQEDEGPHRAGGSAPATTAAPPSGALKARVVLACHLPRNVIAAATTVCSRALLYMPERSNTESKSQLGIAMEWSRGPFLELPLKCAATLLIQFTYSTVPHP